MISWEQSALRRDSSPKVREPTTSQPATKSPRKPESENPLNDVYRRLAGLGFTRAYIEKHALPDWWDDAIGLTGAGYLEALMVLSRRLGVDFDSLRDPEAPARFTTFGVPKFKLARGARPEDVELACALASNAARTVCWTLREEPPCVVPSDALVIRRNILEAGSPCVSLEKLLDECWRMRVPVLPIGKFPSGPGRKKMDGLAARFYGRPAIVLSSKRSAAYLLFHLAHELGHIALNHLPDEGVLLDEGLDADRPDTASDRLESEEVEANRFALELLTGDPDLHLSHNRLLKGEELAGIAVKFGAGHRIDPGVVVLNYAFCNEKQWGTAGAALKRLGAERGEIGGLEPIRRKLFENLDAAALPDETVEWLRRVTGCPGE